MLVFVVVVVVDYFVDAVAVDSSSSSSGNSLHWRCFCFVISTSPYYRPHTSDILERLRLCRDPSVSKV